MAVRAAPSDTSPGIWDALRNGDSEGRGERLIKVTVAPENQHRHLWSHGRNSSLQSSVFYIPCPSTRLRLQVCRWYTDWLAPAKFAVELFDCGAHSMYAQVVRIPQAPHQWIHSPSATFWKSAGSVHPMTFDMASPIGLLMALLSIVSHHKTSIQGAFTFPRPEIRLA